MDQIAIGKIRTSHGVKGYLKVLSFSGETEHFLDLKEIVLKNKFKEKSFTVEHVRPAGDSVLMKLKGIESPEVGKSYNGWEIWVPTDSAAPLKAEEYYLRDLIGCEIVSSGVILGSITGIGESSISEMLEVKTDSGIYIVPFIDEFIGEVNIVSRKIELKATWLLE